MNCTIVPVKVVDRQTVVNAVSVLLDQADICDLAIERLRRWQRWELTGKMVWLYEQESHSIPIVKRSIILLLRQCAPTDNLTAAKFPQNAGPKTPTGSLRILSNRSISSARR